MEGQLKTKICRSCKETKNATLLIFGKDKLQPDGLATICKVCRRIKTNALRKNGTSESRILKKAAPDEVRKMSMRCKRCGQQTRAVYIAVSEYEKMKNKFYCEQCNQMVQTDEQLFDSTPLASKVGEVRPSELPFIST